MARLVHLAPASATRSIANAGIRGTLWTIPGPTGALELPRAVFTMPVVPDHATTYQWVRELRRGHDERMVAVVLRVADDEPVYVGRYSEPHARMSASQGSAWVKANPVGAQLVLPRSVKRREVIAVRTIGQLVGWTESPVATAKADCFCPMCVPSGLPGAKRRVMAGYRRLLERAKRASTSEDRAKAIRATETALERIARRCDAAPFLAWARADAPEVRRAAIGALAQLRGSAVQAALATALRDPDPHVQRDALDALLHAARPTVVLATLEGCGDEKLVELAASLPYAKDRADARRAAEMLARHASDQVRSEVEGLEWD